MRLNALIPGLRGWTWAVVAALVALVAITSAMTINPDAALARSDITKPVFVSGSVNANRLTLTFNEELDIGSAPAGSAFVVRAIRGGSILTLNGTATAAISAGSHSRVVKVMLDGRVHQGDRVTVRYTEPEENALQDKAGNIAKSFHFALANLTPNNASDQSPPTISWARVDKTTSVDIQNGDGHAIGTTLVLGFNQQLDLPSPPAVTPGSAFSVTVTNPVNSQQRTIRGTGTVSTGELRWDTAGRLRILVPTPVARVTLSGPVLRGETVNVSYTAPTQFPLQDPAGNAVANFSRNVANNIPLPMATRAVVMPSTAGSAYNQLIVTFDQELDPNSSPSGSAFTVTSHSGTRTGTGTAAISGSTATVTLNSPIPGGLTVTYTKPSSGNRLRDMAHNEVPSFTLVVSSTGLAPVCANGGYWGVSGGASGNPGALSRIPCDMLNPSWSFAGDDNDIGRIVWRHTPPVNQPVTSVIYSVPDHPDHRVVTAPDNGCYREERVNGLWLRSGSYRVDSVTPGCREASWNAYHRALRLPVINPDGGTFPSGSPPAPAVFESAVVNGATLTLTFDQSLDTASMPAPTDFYVSVNNARRSVASNAIDISGSTVTLTLSSAVSPSDAVQVRYNRPSTNSLRGTNGIPVKSFTDRDVTNNTFGTLWSATLTAGPSGQNGNGCRAGSGTPCSTALTEDSFTVGGTTYRVEILAAGLTASSANFVEIGLDREINTSWTLFVGTFSGLAVSDATPSNSGKTARWINPGWGIGSGEQFSVSLRWAPVDSVSVSASVPTGSSLKRAPPVIVPDKKAPSTADASWTAPSVTDVEVSSSPASGDTYQLGETITIAVTFSEAVDVTGTPHLKIDMDPAVWGEKRASYASGSGTATLTFTHTVVQPNYSTQGIAVLANSLALNGGTIRSSASQADAELSHINLSHNANHKVNWRPAPLGPSVNSVEVSSSPASGDTYQLGETITIAVTFSEAVDVTGMPQLKIDMDPADWGTKVVGYASGSGTATLTFTHTVVQPNYSTQGIAVLANSLALNGGSIRSSASQADADLSHIRLDHNADHKVNWRLPDGGPGS